MPIKKTKQVSNIYDLYFLNNNRYLKLYEDKLLSLRYVVKITIQTLKTFYLIMTLQVFF